jgi:hypothetical protein
MSSKKHIEPMVHAFQAECLIIQLTSDIVQKVEVGPVHL